MLLYPELPGPVAEGLIVRLASLSLEEARQESNIWHPAAIYAATGGNRADSKALMRLQKMMRDTAQQHGYPDQPNARQKRDFDAASGKLLHQEMYITPSAASRAEVWNFMACVLLPDIVRWRFPGDDNVTSRERFQGKSRGLRNTFGRVWWRAYILYQPGAESPYGLLERFGEDELVQIMERPGIAGSPVLAKQICHSFLETCQTNGKISNTSELWRDAMKRLRRLLPLISFDALDDEVLRQLINDIFAESASALFVYREGRLRGIA
jgi:hypothetical protein